MTHPSDVGYFRKELLIYNNRSKLRTNDSAQNIRNNSKIK